MIHVFLKRFIVFGGSFRMIVIKKKMENQDKKETSHKTNELNRAFQWIVSVSINALRINIASTLLP